MTKTKIFTLAALATLAPMMLANSAHASDHADTPTIAKNPGLDLTDVYIFPSATNPNNVVLAMNVNPLIGPGQGGNASFDPNVLYQFKIDNNGDSVEDLVIQAKFQGFGRFQRARVSPPLEPWITGTSSFQQFYPSRSGTINSVYSSNGMKVFAGAREDSFFFDLEQFFTIFPDRATPLSGVAVENPNNPQATSWRPKGQAVDFLSNGGYNVLSIVVELPRAKLLRHNGHNTVIAVWCTTSSQQSFFYKQVDRLSRPAINEVFATVAGNQHQTNDEIAPKDDINFLKLNMDSFLTFPAGRSAAIRNVLTSVLIPDVLKADLGSSDKASYLGYETGGATGGKFGGRGLSDDVIDISLGAIFGNIIPSLGLAPDDGNEIPSLTSDNVGAEGKHFMSRFPYLGTPR